MEGNKFSKKPEKDTDLTYDEAAKNVLSNKVIVANILKASISELENHTIEQIRAMLKSGVNENKVECYANDDAHSDMATVSFDIDIRLQNKEIPLDIEIDIEPQGKLFPTYEGKKYSIYKRALYYVCRMIVRQLGEGDNDYNKLHKCCSIWICFQKDGNSNVSMTKHGLRSLLKEMITNKDCTEQEAERARKYLEKADSDIDLIEVIMIYIPKSYEKSELEIQKFLYSIFNNSREGVKEAISTDEWQTIESEVNKMGHLEAELKDMYKAEGRAEGEMQTKFLSVNKLVANKIFSFEEALKFEELSREDYERFKPAAE